jgi:hypothetical protein
VTLLGLQEMDLKVHKAILAVELEHGLHPLDGRDLSAELDKVCVSVNKMTEDYAIWGLLPFDDIPQLPKIAQRVLLPSS